jgi:hypothetical protein
MWYAVQECDATDDAIKNYRWHPKKYPATRLGI